jgi:hypothetical protein
VEFETGENYLLRSFIIVLFTTHNYMDHQTKEDKMGETCGMHGRKNLYRFWRGNRKEED